jgi:rubredoxin
MAMYVLGMIDKAVPDVREMEVVKISKWECTVCGYVYDPELGDPDSDIEPGTAFEDLPEDWVCPECGVGKEDFEKIED